MFGTDNRWSEKNGARSSKTMFSFMNYYYSINCYCIGISQIFSEKHLISEIKCVVNKSHVKLSVYRTPVNLKGNLIYRKKQFNSGIYFALEMPHLEIDTLELKESAPF